MGVGIGHAAVEVGRPHALHLGDDDFDDGEGGEDGGGGMKRCCGSKGYLCRRVHATVTGGSLLPKSSFAELAEQTPSFLPSQGLLFLPQTRTACNTDFVALSSNIAQGIH